VVIEVQFRKGCLYLLLSKIVAALGKQLEIVLTCFVAFLALGDYHLQDIFVESRPLLQNLRLLNLEKKDFAQLRFLLNMNESSKEIVEVALAQQTYLMIEFSQNSEKQKLLILVHCFAVDIHEGFNHLLELLGLVRI
jgi:hypothetical protein